ncbi:MAG: hypothetical protein F8N37_03500 [Telmatospirillum sp.]|nr:hypothetical protein [Telmatospirillum sp.]
MMGRGGKYAIRTLAALIVLAPVLLLGIVNIDMLRPALLETLNRAGGGRILIAGLAGRFPGDFSLDRLRLGDSQGVWLDLEGLRLDWSPMALLTGGVRIARLEVRRLMLSRIPGRGGESSSGLPSLPALEITTLSLGRVELGAPVTGHPWSFALGGHVMVDPAGHADIDLSGEEFSPGGRFTMKADVGRDRGEMALELVEGDNGPVSDLLGLSDLGGLGIKAAMTGPLAQERLDLTLTAGPLTLTSGGTLNLEAGTVALDIAARAPALPSSQDVSWRSLRLGLRVDGAFGHPDARGNLAIDDLSVPGVLAADVSAELTGTDGDLRLEGLARGVRPLGAPASLMAKAPLALAAEVHLAEPGMPLAFALTHPLMEATGRVDLDGPTSGETALWLPSLVPYAALAGIGLSGEAMLHLDFRGQSPGTALALTGTVSATGGTEPLSVMIGRTATIDAVATVRGANIAIDHVRFDSATLRAALAGSIHDHAPDLDWSVTAPDLTPFGAPGGGGLAAKGRFTGPARDPVLSAEIAADLASAGLPRGAVTATLAAHDLKTLPVLEADLRGMLARQPFDLRATAARRQDGRFDVTVERAAWRSVDIRARLVAGGDGALPAGQIVASVGRLDDLHPLTGTSVPGALQGTLDLAGGQGPVRISAAMTDLFVADARFGRIDVTGTVDQPTRRPSLALQAVASGIEAAGLSGGARLTASGPSLAPGLRLSGDFRRPDGSPLSIDAEASADLARHRLDLSALQLRGCGTAARLPAPARLSFGDGLSLDRVQMTSGPAVASLSGRLAPRLDLRASVSGLGAALVGRCLSLPLAEGVLSLDAVLVGTPDVPTGSVHAAGHGIRVAGVAGMAPGEVELSAELAGRAARIRGSLRTGQAVGLSLGGTVPLDDAGPLDLAASGTVDLAVLGPVLLGGERAMAGKVTVDLTATGPVFAPCLGGRAVLAKGSVQDYAQGIAVHDIDARLEARCGQVPVLSLTGRAGDGTIGIDGTIDPLAPGMPVDLAVRAHNARPLAGDLLSAILDAEAKITGPATGRLALAGSIHVHRADITIPESFASRVAILSVRRRGETPPPPAPPSTAPDLDLSIDAPGQIFVRGHGIDAEMSGRVHLTGTGDAPEVGGGFTLRRGTFALAGKTLEFVSGRVSFDGGGITHKIDPTLHFVAQSSSPTVNATLTVGGYADAPTVELASVPSLPQDEILAQLIFGQSVKQLSPMQIAEIAQAVASLTNVGGGLDPLGAIRKGLGLDRLSAGSGAAGGGASVQAGKYVAEGVYVGAEQGTQGGTRAQVQIDLTRSLKLETTVGTGGASGSGAVTPENDPGSSVGLTYRVEY